jgi:hypothetical protein|tara:strand:- start:201 stop:449 length:249 start_codon:yes stop_codon:yes gene_type:complete
VRDVFVVARLELVVLLGFDVVLIDLVVVVTDPLFDLTDLVVVLTVGRVVLYCRVEVLVLSALFLLTLETVPSALRFDKLIDR